MKNLSKLYYSPTGYWKGLAAISKLADEANLVHFFSKNFMKMTFDTVHFSHLFYTGK